MGNDTGESVLRQIDIMGRRTRLAYLVTHPIQYQAPLLRLIAQQPDISLKVFYCSDVSTGSFYDPEFGRIIKWDVPLVEGYDHEYLSSRSSRDGVLFWKPRMRDLGTRIDRGKFDVLWVHGWGSWRHVRAILDARRLGIKVLLRGEASLHLRKTSRRLGGVRDRFVRWLLSKVDGVLAIGAWNKQFYIHFGVDLAKIHMVPYAVDNEFFQAETLRAGAGREALRASLGLERGRPVILYASKLTARKRPHDLLEAYACLSADGRSEPRPYLLFVGDGEQRSSLEERTRTLGWRSIRFLGFKNQTELPRFFDLCDVFVLPSLNEPWGLVVNEAMNAGKAVVVSDQVGAGADLVRAGKNGVIFAAGNVGELARGLAFVLEDERYVDMGKRSLEAISQWGFHEDIAGLRHALAAVVGTA